MCKDGRFAAHRRTVSHMNLFMFVYINNKKMKHDAQQIQQWRRINMLCEQNAILHTRGLQPLKSYLKKNKS